MSTSTNKAGERFRVASLTPSEKLRRLRDSARTAWELNRLLLYAAVVGVFGGLGAQVFTWMLDWGERIFSVGLAGYTHPASGVLHPAPHFGPWGVWLIPVATTVGGLLCGLLVYSLAPEAEGHGTDAAVAAYHFHAGKVRPIVPAVKAVASALTIGSGGAAGREGPTAQISVGAASVLCDLLHLEDSDRRILVLAGMAAGLAAIFRSPLGMAIFAVEIMYASMASEYDALPFTLAASVVAYAVNGLFVGWSPIFLIPGNLAFTRPLELLGYAILGIAAGIVGAVEPSIFYGIRDLFRRIPLPNHVKPALGGLLMGLLAMAFPQTTSTGYGWVQMAMTSGYVGHILIALVFVKILAMSLTISSGGSGGVFGPNVYIGAMLGGWVAFVMDHWFPAAHFVPAAFAVVGMGAVFAGTARVPLATLIMVAEMTGGYGLIVPAMLASSLSFMVQRGLTARARYPRLYEAQVEGRLDSPVHHLRIIQGAFRLVENGSLPNARINLPDLSRLLRVGDALSIHGGKGRIFPLRVDVAESPLIGRPAGDAVKGNRHLLLVAVLRGAEVLPAPTDVLLTLGDTLVLATDDAAHAERTGGPLADDGHPPAVGLEPGDRFLGSWNPPPVFWIKSSMANANIPVTWGYSGQVETEGVERQSSTRDAATGPVVHETTSSQEVLTMLYIVETTKDVETAARDLEAAVKRNKFGVLHVHDLQKTLKEKGVDFPNACRILDVCNPQRAMQVLSVNMGVNMALPCRISVYREGGKTKMGMIKPTALLALFPEATDLTSVADEVERETMRMIDEAK